MHGIRGDADKLDMNFQSILGRKGAPVLQRKKHESAPVPPRKTCNLRICRSVACRILTDSLFLLVLVTVSSRARDRLGREFVIHHESGLNDTGLWRSKLRARSTWSVVKARRRCKT